MIKRFKEKLTNTKVHQYWTKCYESSMRNMSHGAQEILKLITSAHGSNWRRGREKRKEGKKK